MKSQKQKRFKGLIKTVSIVTMGAICLTTAVSVAALSKTVTITDGEQIIKINTMNPDTQEILDMSGITLGKNDKLVRTDDNGNNINISILRAFNVDVIDGNITKTLTVNNGTVADALKAAGMKLSGNDAISFSTNTELEPDMEIKIARWYEISLDVKGEKTDKEVPAGTVSEALDFLNITLGKNDVLNIDKDKKVSDGLEIVIQEVTYKEVTTTESVDFKTVYKDTDDLYIGDTQVEQEGKKGTRTIVTREKYINGNLDSTKQLSNKITEKSRDKIILRGTAEKVSKFETASGSVSVNETEQILTDVSGNKVSYKQVLTGSGTAYYAPEGALTSTGRLAQYGVVAVNPYIIPYGSQLYIVSNDGQVVYGYAVAGDTGGALMDGSAICDLYYPTYEDCCQFGRRDITIYVLE